MCIRDRVYTGSDIKPTVTVEDDGKALELLSDYTLMYSNNRKAGTGVAAVAGKGNYTATKNLTFDIRPVSYTHLSDVYDCPVQSYKHEDYCQH